MRARAAGALGTLCVLSDQNKAATLRADAVPSLLRLLNDEEGKRPALVVLRSLAEESEAHKYAIQEAAAKIGGKARMEDVHHKIMII